MTPTTEQSLATPAFSRRGRPLPPPGRWALRDGTEVTIRPIRPGDKTLELNFLNALSPQSIYQRLLSMRRLLPGELERLTNIDYDREMALIATVGSPGAETQVGVARYVRDDDHAGAGAEGEFAIVIADAYHCRGLGRRLLGSLIDEARDAGLRRLWGIALATNEGMRELARSLGFALGPHPDDATITRVVKAL